MGGDADVFSLPDEAVDAFEQSIWRVRPDVS